MERGGGRVPSNCGLRVTSDRNYDLAYSLDIVDIMDTVDIEDIINIYLLRD